MFPYAQRRPFHVFTTIPQLQIKTCIFYMISWTVCTLDHWDVFTSFPYTVLKKTFLQQKKRHTNQTKKKHNKTIKIHQEQIPGLLFAHGYAETRGFHLSDESPTHATTTFTANRRVPNGPEVWQHWESANFRRWNAGKNGVGWMLFFGLGVFVEFVRTICS